MERGVFFDRDYAAVVEELYTRGLNDRDPRVVQRLVTPDLVVHHLDTGEETRGREAFVKEQATWLTAVPDYYVEVEEVVTDADRAVARLTCYGTPVRPHAAARPTGRSFAVSSLHEYRFEDGKIAEAWLLDDRMAMVRQLGLLPDSLGDLFRVAGHRLRWLLFGRPRTARGKPIDPEADVAALEAAPETEAETSHAVLDAATGPQPSPSPVVGASSPEPVEEESPLSADPVSPAAWRAADRLGRARTTVNKDCEVDDDGWIGADSVAGDGVSDDRRTGDERTGDERSDETLTDAETPPSARV